jgi:putative phage-type endonuclease
LTENNPTQVRTAELIGNFTPSDPEWHELRLKGITGTDAGTILGVNPFASAYSLWCKKTGRIDDEVVQNQRMRLGQLLETPLLTMFTENNPELNVFTGGTYRHKDHPWLIANPDALATDADGKLYVIEVKTARQYWEEIPPHYVAQCLHYADVFSADGIKLVALTGGDYREYDIPVEIEMLEAQRAAVEDFWLSVGNDTEPNWDGSESTYEAVRSMVSKDFTEDSVELGDLGMHLSNANANFKAAENDLNTLKSATLAQMGDAKYGVVEVEGTTTIVAVKKSRAGGKPWLEIKG